MVTSGDLFGRDQCRELKPGLIHDLKKLIKQVCFTFCASNQKQNALTQQGEYPDVQEQLQNIEKWQQPESPYLCIRFEANLLYVHSDGRTLRAISDSFLTKLYKYRHPLRIDKYQAFFVVMTKG